MTGVPLGLLGLGMRAGAIVVGTGGVRAALQRGQLRLVVVASDREPGLSATLACWADRRVDSARAARMLARAAGARRAVLAVPTSHAPAAAEAMDQISPMPERRNDKKSFGAFSRRRPLHMHEKHVVRYKS